jgi:hypothetical protein
MFEKNIETFREHHPEVANTIEAADYDHTSWCTTRNDEVNLCYFCDGKKHHLHSNYNIQRENEKWFQSLELEDTEDGYVLYIYGIGLGYSYDIIKPWLDESVKHSLVYLEDDTAILRRFFETNRAADILEDKQVSIFYLGDTKDQKEAKCQFLSQFFIHLSFSMVPLPHYGLVKRGDFDSIRLTMHHAAAYGNFTSLELLSFGKSHFLNLYHSLLFLEKSQWGYSLLKRFKGVPAIVCGAGPSLDKNFDLLKNLESRALILAGGSAIPALSSRGLMPHIGATVDPNPLQYDRLTAHSAYELPMFYKSRVNYRAFRSIHGPRIYLPGSGTYPVTNLIDQKMGIHAQNMREGHNVLHILIDLAAMLQCDPIIFVGMDLGYSGMKFYANGVVEDNEASKEKITKRTHLNDNCFLRKDIYGDPMYTLWKWVAESKFSARYPNTYPDATFINATEGGLGMGEDIPNIDLKDVAEKHLVQQYDIRNWLHSEIQEHASFPEGSNTSKEKVLEILKELKESLEEFIETAKMLKTHFVAFKEAAENDDQRKLNSITFLLEKYQEYIQKNTAYQHIIQPLTSIQSILSHRDLDQIELDPSIEDRNERILKMADTNTESLSTSICAAETNAALITQAIKSYGIEGYGSVDSFFTTKEEKKENTNTQEKTTVTS